MSGHSIKSVSQESHGEASTDFSRTSFIPEWPIGWTLSKVPGVPVMMSRSVWDFGGEGRIVGIESAADLLAPGLDQPIVAQDGECQGRDGLGLCPDSIWTFIGRQNGV